MGKTKKLLSVFLAFLMVLSSVTVGLTAFAADEIKTYDGLDENHQALAAALQVSYVVDLNNYKQNATRDYVAYDNKDGDIAKAADAFYKCISASADAAISDKKRYSDVIKAVETTLKNAMGKDYTTNMNKVIGFLCGNGTLPSTSLNYSYKFTVNMNMDELLAEYNGVSEIPATVADKATLYTYTQASNVFKSAECATAAAKTALFTDFAKYYSSEAMAKDVSALTKTEVDNYVKNGQNILNNAKIISLETISRLLGNTVTFEAAQTYLNSVLVFKANEYTVSVNAIGDTIGSKELSDFDFAQLKTLKTALDAANRLYTGYVQVQKEAVKDSYTDYNTYLKFYQDSFNYNTALDYAEAVKKVEQYSSSDYSFTKEELNEVKTLLDAADKIYKTFIAAGAKPESVATNKAIYDQALSNYNTAFEYYSNLAYNNALNAFVATLDKQAVLDIPETAEVTKNNYLRIADDLDNDVLAAENSFVAMINALFETKKASNLAAAVKKISDDLKNKIGADVFEQKYAEEIINCLYGAPAASSATGQRYVEIEEAYLFKYNSIDELLVPDEIQYTLNRFTIKNTAVATITEVTETDENAQGAFSGFVNLFTDELLDTDIEKLTFDELSLIRRKSSIVLNNLSTYSEKAIFHFIDSAKYSAAQLFYSRCEEIIERNFNKMITDIDAKYGNREITAEEARAFFTEAAVIEKAYTQLSDAVKASETVTANMEKLNNLKASIKLIVDKADAEEFIELVKTFEDKYPKKNLNMDIYEAFNADIKPILDFYNNCSEETKAMEDVIKASDDLTELNNAMDAVFRAYRFEQFKEIVPEKLDPLYTGDLENAQIIEFTTFDIANIKQIMAEINKIYGDLSDEARIDEFVVNYMAVVSKLQERITLLTNPPEFKPYTVEYPENVTQEQVQDILSRLDGVIAGDLIESLLDQPLDEAVDGLLNGLFTADIINTLVKALYPMVKDALGSDASIAGIAKIYVMPNTLGQNSISHYPSVKAALLAAGDDWSKVDWELFDWVNSKGVPVHDLESFIDALGEALSGVTPILNCLLNGKALILNILPGNAGYEKDVLPLLELLGCNETHGLKSAADFNAVMSDVPQMLKYIIYPLLNRVKELLRENTVTDLLGIIANLSFVVSNDMLHAGFTDLVWPLSDKIDLVQTLKDAGIDLTNLIGTINGFLGSTGIKLPVLNWAEFAGIGTYHTDGASIRPSGVRNYIDAAEPDVLVQLLYYVYDVIAANKDTVLGLLGDSLSPEIRNIIVNALETDKKAFVGAVLQLLVPYDAPDYIWPEFNYSKTDVNYSAYTSADVKAMVDKLSSIVTNVIALLLNGSLNDLISQNLYTGDMVQTIFNAVKGLYDNETAAIVVSLITVTDAEGNAVKLDISKDAIAENFKSDFPKVAKAINNADSISKAVIEAADWKIETEEDFVNALTAITAPIAPVISALLAGDGVTVSIADGAVQLYGANGYNNAVKPLLDALTCETMEVSEYNEQAAKDNKNALVNIVNPLLGLVNRIAADPIHSVIDILPHAALFIDNNGIQTAVAQLLAPLNNILDAVKTLIGTDNIYEWLVDDLLSGLAGTQLNWNKLQNQVISLLNDKVLNNININGTAVSLKLNDINWGKLAGCLDKDGNVFSSNTSDTAVTLVDYVWRAVKANEAVIRDLIKSVAGENYETVAVYVEKVLTLESTDLVKMLVELTKGLDASSFKADWSFLYEGFKKTTVKLPAGVSKADIEKTVETVSQILNKVVEMLLDGSLNELVDGALYTDSLITTIAKAVYSLGENSTVNTVLGVLGIDLSKDAIAETLGKDYPSVSKAIKEAESLGAADTSKWEWNAEDKETFTEALAAVLRPFAPALNVLLNSGELNVAGVVDFRGSNGYENAVKPLLDALGCTTVSAAQYAKDAEKNADNLVLNIVNPVLDLEEEILANPVEKTAEILPQAANFIDKGGIQYAVESLLYPVTNLVSPLVSVITDKTVFDFIIDMLGIDINWKNLQNDIIPMLNNSVLKEIDINGKKVSLVLPNISWSKLAGCGNSAKDGIDADTADVTVTLVDYVWRTVKANEKAVKRILSDLLGDTYKTLSPYINKLLAVNSSKLIKIFVDIIKNLDASSFKANWSFLYKNYKASSVSLPDGVTSKDLAEVVEILTNALNNGLGILLDSSLVSIVGNELYTDDLITTIAKAVYSLSEDETVSEILNILGVDLSKDAIVSSLKKNYPSVSKAIRNSKSLSKLDTSKWKWNVTDKKSFAKALAAVLRPFAPALNVLLNSGELNVAGVVDFRGSNGYENAVKPLLDALGCITVSAAQYAKDAKKNADNLVLNIVNPVLDLAEEILANPVEKTAEILPQAANFIDKGGIQYAVESLLYPITNLLNPIVSVITDETVFDFIIDMLGIDINWKNLQNDIIPMLNNSVLKNININGKKLAVKLPAINWRSLAGCGTLANGRIKADTSKELITLLRYVFKALKANQNTVVSLIGNNAVVKQIIKNVINCGADEITRIVVNILLKMKTVNNASWSFRNLSASPIAYTENLGRDDFITILEQIDPMINELLSDFAGKSLTNLVTGLVYTNNIVNTLAELIYTNLEKLDIGIDINTVLSMLDVDISTSAVAEAVSDYRSASKVIAKCSKWSQVKFENINWGFQDGNREGFVNALSAVLRPLFPVLRAVLSADELVVLDSITIKGGNGYNTAIVPIAEALGINENQLVSVASYVNQADSDKLLTNILNPLLDRVEEILASPVSKLAEILPNVAYFIENDGIYNAASNLIKPVTNILDEIAPVYELKLDLSMLRNLDLAGIVNSLLSSVNVNGKSLGIKLSGIDLKVLAGRGSLQNYTSVRTYNGVRMNAKRVVADKPAVLLSVLRYIVQNLKTNLNAINGLLAGLDISDDILEIINTVLDALATEDVDAVIELLADILFDINSGEIVLTPEKPAETDEFVPFIPGNFYWVYWVIFAVAVALIGVGLFFILKNKKNKAEEHTDVK